MLVSNKASCNFLPLKTPQNYGNDIVHGLPPLGSPVLEPERQLQNDGHESQATEDEECILKLIFQLPRQGNFQIYPLGNERCMHSGPRDIVDCNADGQQNAGIEPSKKYLSISGCAEKQPYLPEATGKHAGAFLFAGARLPCAMRLSFFAFQPVSKFRRFQLSFSLMSSPSPGTAA